MATEFNARDSRIQGPGLGVQASPVSTVAAPAAGKKGGLFGDLVEGLSAITKPFDQLAQVKTQEQAIGSADRAQADQLKAGTVDPRPGFGPADDVFYKEARFQVFANQKAADLELQFDGMVDQLVKGDDKQALMDTDPKGFAEDFAKQNLEGVTDPALIKAIVPRLMRGREQAVQKITVAKQKEQARRDHERAFGLLSATYDKGYTPEGFTETAVALRASGLNDMQFGDAMLDVIRVNSMKGNGDPRLVEWAYSADIGNGLTYAQLMAKTGNDKAVKELTDLKTKVDAQQEKALADNRKQAVDAAELQWTQNSIDPAYLDGNDMASVSRAVLGDTSLSADKKGQFLKTFSEHYAKKVTNKFAKEVIAAGGISLLTNEQKKEAIEPDFRDAVNRVTAAGKANAGALNMLVKKVVDLSKQDGTYKSEAVASYLGKPSVESYGVDASGRFSQFVEGRWQFAMTLEQTPEGRVTLDKYLTDVADRTFVPDVLDAYKSNGGNLEAAVETVRNVRKSITPQIIESNRAQTRKLEGSGDFLNQGMFEDFLGDNPNEVSSGSVLVRDQSIPVANRNDMRRTFSREMAKLDSKKMFGSDEDKARYFRQNIFQAQYVPVEWGPTENGTSHYVRVPRGSKSEDMGKQLRAFTDIVRLKAAKDNVAQPGALMLEAADEEASSFRVVNADGDAVSGFRAFTLDEIKAIGSKVMAAGAKGAADKLKQLPIALPIASWYAQHKGRNDAELQQITQLRDSYKLEAEKQQQMDRALPPINIQDLKKRNLPALVRSTVFDNLGSDPAFALTASLEGYVPSISPDNKGQIIGYGYNVQAQLATLDRDFKAAGIADKDAVLAGKTQITEPQARALYQQVRARNEVSVRKEVERIGGNWEAMPENRKAAILHMAYNAGAAGNLTKQGIAAVVSNRVDDIKSIAWTWSDSAGKKHVNDKLLDAVWAMARGLREFEMTLK